MTIAKFKIYGNKYEVNVQGHAAYSPKGVPDIVCSACSTLVYTLLQVLMAEREEGNLLEYRDYINENDGHYRITFEAHPETSGYIECIVNVIASGFMLLAHKYPKHVKYKVALTDVLETRVK